MKFELVCTRRDGTIALGTMKIELWTEDGEPIEDGDEVPSHIVAQVIAEAGRKRPDLTIVSCTPVGVIH